MDSIGVAGGVGISGAGPRRVFLSHTSALAIRERVLGPDHPRTAFTLNDLALLLRAQDELDAARDLLERALAIRERVLGPDHPLTASTRGNLADLPRRRE